MSFQPEQLLIALFFCACGYLTYRVRSVKFSFFMFCFLLTLFLMNPFRMTATPIQQTTNNAKFNALPERVIVKEQSFEEFNESKANNLNQQNERTHNEIQP